MFSNLNLGADSDSAVGLALCDVFVAVGFDFSNLLLCTYDTASSSSDLDPDVVTERDVMTAKVCPDSLVAKHRGAEEENLLMLVHLADLKEASKHMQPLSPTTKPLSDATGAYQMKDFRPNFRLQ
ncbi:hypothetical protein M231_05061 [Tremella mesenterica]|uniref:Uncharacterized protein n=1 Tax=Tremella mesenterica TaxID=5217 RepID=A0A4Q1BIZ4_TREME|nr:hypothetical protein M231_05061 [Tremella mesenterica]